MQSPQRERSLGSSKSKGNDLKRATYYLRPEQIKALKLKAVHAEQPVSELLREAVDLYLRQSPAQNRRPINQRMDEFLSVD